MPVPEMKRKEGAGEGRIILQNYSRVVQFLGIQDLGVDAAAAQNGHEEDPIYIWDFGMCTISPLVVKTEARRLVKLCASIGRIGKDQKCLRK